MPKCLTEGCTGEWGSHLPKGRRGGRGLCKYCCTTASLLVKRGTTTWEELERLGLAYPKRATLLEQVLVRKRLENKKKETDDLS